MKEGQITLIWCRYKRRDTLDVTFRKIVVKSRSDKLTFNEIVVQ